MFEIGINTNNESGANSVSIIKNIAKSGFRSIMLSAYITDREKVLKVIKKNGIEISCFHLDGKCVNSIWAEGATADRYIDKIIQEIELCGQLNINVAIMHITDGNPACFALPPSEVGLNNIKKVLDVAKRNNVKLAVENLDNAGFSHVDYVLENIKDEYLGFCYDVGHHHLYNPKVDLLKKYGDRLLVVHLHDNMMDWHWGYDYTRDLHLLPMDGKINLQKVCEKLAKLNYEGVMILEVHKTCKGAPHLYTDMKDLDFLNEAYNRAGKLKDMIMQAKK
ncbi:MAG: sugar phosphate isomerase/epimerase [Clostridia bacterium]|nr:sugar phosphate isomerase/epimerase [Clostridia bacterium]